MLTKKIKNISGITLIELLIALFITGILAIASMSFYTSLHQQVLSQQEITDIQQLNRACLEELSTALKSAGYGLPDSLPAYEEFTDSLIVYYADSGFIDTIYYYLEEFSDSEYASLVIGSSANHTLYKLMKRINSEDPVEFANFITDLRFTVISANLIAITVENQTALSDETFSDNDGFRKFTNTERVVIRNI